MGTLPATPAPTAARVNTAAPGGLAVFARNRKQRKLNHYILSLQIPASAKRSLKKVHVVPEMRRAEDTAGSTANSSSIRSFRFLFSLYEPARNKAGKSAE